MNLSDFDFSLPPELVASEPLSDRTASRMLVIHRATGTWEDRTFRDLPSYLRSGDCLVLNDTRVFPARLLGHREGFQGEVEMLMTRALTEGDGNTWLCLVHPGRKVRSGDTVLFGERLRATVLGRNEHGERIVRFEVAGGGGDLMTEVERVGHVPLPPYMNRPDRPSDRERYQTVFAGDERGSAAAPTAGLHFTPEVLERCRAAGADIARITLHVGLGTFQPIRVERLEDVKLHSEWFRVTPQAAGQIAAARRRIAVGTTAVRTLESVMQRAGRIEAMQGDTDLFISPGFRFGAVNAMLTNFHLPKSSLLVLVSAFMGRDLALAAYRHAVEARYRFYSYGDCMLIL